MKFDVAIKNYEECISNLDDVALSTDMASGLVV